jgi:GR25 family glycosyltransferase involved in LPS biosynthesis
MIIVLCPKESNRSYRWNFNEEIQREFGYWKDDPILLDKLDEYKFMPSTKTKTKLPNVACLEGHVKIWNRIIDEDLNNVLIVEDDSDIEYERYDKFLKETIPDGLIYLGGRFDPPKIKDWSKGREVIEKYIEDDGEQKKLGFNKVNDDFIITGTHGYFIKDKHIAKYMLDNCKGKTNKYKSTLVDMCISKIKIDKYYYYPSIVSVECLPSLCNHSVPSGTCKNYQTCNLYD